MDLSKVSNAELLVHYAAITEELRSREILRTSNNPTGDLAEYIFCKAFGWKLECNSKAHIDAIGDDGLRYQIKSRRITQHNNSRQMSAIRNLSEGHFDFLACVLFSEDYKVLRAAIVPIGTVKEMSKYVGHTNSHKFILCDDVWSVAGVRDVTQELNSVQL